MRRKTSARALFSSFLFPRFLLFLPHTIMSFKTSHIKDIQGFVFDLDGTLMDTTPLIIKHWHAFALEHGLDAEKILASSHGQRTIDTIAKWVPEKATQEHVDYYERKLAMEPEGVTVLPGVARLLESIPLGKWSIYTAGTKFMAESRLKQCNIPIPAGLVTADKVTNGKPHPEGYLKGAELINAPANKCIVFEDAPHGIKSGKAAGMTVIACTTTHSAEQLRAAGADYVVDYLSEVEVHITGDGHFEVEVRELE
ncbi:HAD-like domain-containing protein [Gongronella butleri]|nr:HAD-like domain-containing protein [Gongronella butleri]